MSSNPFLTRVARKGKTGHGSLSEKRLAKLLTGKQTPRSGGLRWAKGDITKDGKCTFLLEAKSTVRNRLTLELGWLVKIAVEALNAKAVPALAVRFVTPEGKARDYGDWVCIPRHTFAELTDEVPD